MAALDEGVLSAVINSNFKSIAEMGTINALMAQNRQHGLLDASLAQQLNKMNSLDPTEAAAIGGVVNSDLAETLAQLGGSVSALQQLMKGAKTTLPETGR